ncbi:MAG: hypothetical protein ACP5XB_04565 [Isosphaeraceae bacterium]
MDLRERVAAAVDEGEFPQREIARISQVSLSFVSRLLLRRQNRTLAPKPHGGGPTPVLSPNDERRLEEFIKKHNHNTLEMLRRSLIKRTLIEINSADHVAPMLEREDAG